jgi:hypothetical protein
MKVAAITLFLLVAAAFGVLVVVGLSAPAVTP